MTMGRTLNYNYVSSSIIRKSVPDIITDNEETFLWPQPNFLFN